MVIYGTTISVLHKFYYSVQSEILGKISQLFGKSLQRAPSITFVGLAYSMPLCLSIEQLHHSCIS